MSGSSKKTKDAKTLHFFRIILGHDQKLGLPKRFVISYGNDLSNSVLLAAPSGPVWQVELIKCDGEIWLGNGWKDFADYFSLKYGNLLVFRYEGQSRFYVSMIFDQSTFEIEYPINISSSKDANHDVELQMPKVEEIQSDVSVEINESISQRQKTIKKTALPRFSPYERMRTTLSNGIQGTWNVKISGDTSGKISIPSAREASRHTSAALRYRPSNKAPRKVQSSTPKRNGRTSSKASNFKSENPFFVVVMQPSYLTGCPLHIPVAFARTYFTRKQDDVILQDLDGKTWSVHYKVYENNYETHFLHGWKEFAQYHNLKVGDTCAFELLEGLGISLRVTMFRDAEDANDHLTAARGSENGRVKRKRGLNTRSQSESDYTSEDEVITSWSTTKESHVPRTKIKTEHRKLKQVMQNETAAWRVIRRLSSKGAARAFERASKKGFNHPVFKVVITANILWNTYPTVPKSFCKEFIRRIPQDLTLKFKDKSWSVRLSTRLDRRARFGAGWRAFALENKLQVGNVCVFEMIKRRDIVLEVSIFRGSRSLG